MSKDDSFIPVDGVVKTSIMGIYQVECMLGTQKQIVQCRRGGRLKQTRLNIMAGDRVGILVSAADLTKGLIDRRIDARHE